ncbi:MAG TPA: PEP-CTERM/exosortase system-associated acyltransferase, partial [Stellaceae bacterium]
MPDFVGFLNQYFDVIRADTPDLRDLAYRLRYQVYCVENAFEDPTRCSGKREADEDDDRSVHTLLVHRQSGAVAGTARLILPHPGSGRVLPIERILSAARPSMVLLPLQHTGEVSRFAVSREFRRRRSEIRCADAGFADTRLDPAAAEKRLMPHITLGLIRGILAICLDYEITLLAAVMEPALLRILARLGLDFAPLGPLVQYHGLRQPCAANILDLIRGAR